MPGDEYADVRPMIELHRALRREFGCCQPSCVACLTPTPVGFGILMYEGDPEAIDLDLARIPPQVRDAFKKAARRRTKRTPSACTGVSCRAAWPDIRHRGQSRPTDVKGAMMRVGFTLPHLGHLAHQARRAPARSCTAACRAVTGC
jgi:hypothetical protein